jgi:hypothetical protein
VGEPIALFEVCPETGEETALICGELYRRGDGWKFRALGQGYDSGLVGLATEFGISVDEAEEASAAAPGPESHRPARPEPPVPEQRAPAAVTDPVPRPAASAPPAAVLPPAAQPQPVSGYGYPSPPPNGPAAPQPAYGYPQHPAYGYPHQQPQPGPPVPDPVTGRQPDADTFTLPPQGPQFQNR